MSDPVEVAGHVPGFMEPNELAWLAEQAENRKVIVEIGSYMGRSTKALALATSGHVVSVDNLVGIPGILMQAAGKHLDDAFRRNLKSEIKKRKVKVVRKPSVEAAAEFKGKADMVFIDGDHMDPAPSDDIAAWLPKLKKGGLLCGHDYPDSGVAAALEGRAAERGPGLIWWEIIE